MKRNCSMCGQRKPEFMPLAGGWGCRDCCSSVGMSAPKNVAAKNSKEWQKKPCQHQSRSPSYYTIHHTEYYREVCNRCKKTIVNIKVGYHGRRGRT